MTGPEHPVSYADIFFTFMYQKYECCNKAPVWMCILEGVENLITDRKTSIFGTIPADRKPLQTYIINI